MLNAEKYRNEILAISDKNRRFGIREDNPTAIIKCAELNQCSGCLFNNGMCDSNKTRWLLAEYKEPIKLTRLEYEILKWVYNERYKYIARDEDGELWIFQSEPKKITIEWDCYYAYTELQLFNKLFQFVKWEDKEPTSIKDVLDNCEVVENDL